MSIRSANNWLAAYVFVGLVNVIGVFAHVPLLTNLTKPLLMPLLFGYLVVALRGLNHPLVVWVKRALIFSWIGDLLLMVSGEAFFDLGLMAFLAVQICYIIGFRPHAKLGPLHSRPWLALPYIAYGVILLSLLIGDLGPLLIPVVVYAVALVTMAILASGVSPFTGIGGILFLLSDSLIALTELTDQLGAGAADWIMPTYVAGQLLIVQGVLHLLGRSTWSRVPVQVA